MIRVIQYDQGMVLCKQTFICLSHEMVFVIIYSLGAVILVVSPKNNQEVRLIYT